MGPDDDRGAEPSEPALGVLLIVAYDGTPFSGFARQPDARTVAGELDGAVRAIDPRASLVRGVSRTDAGVHARGQVVAFDTCKAIAPRGWALALAQHLPEEISVMAAARVAVGYDPRDHALDKTYRYSVLESPVRDPLLAHRAWRVGERLNHQSMRSEAAALTGIHDFRAFRAAGDPRENTIRHILRAELRASTEDPRLLWIEIQGNRFLYKMVRIIAGTLVDVGRGRLPSGTVASALAAGSRDALGITAPAEGLCLERVALDDPGNDAWPDQFGARLTSGGS
jgi:tRNA pseudouridine38-40 synthase